MRALPLLVAALMAAGTIAVQAQTPVPVAERIITQADISTRVTLFSNQVVVVTIRQNGVQGFNQRITLPDDQYLVYLGILQANAKELGEQPVNSAVNSPHTSVELTLHVGPGSPRLIRFSPMSTVSLELARIIGALDDLENQVRDASPSTEEIRTWDPERGDRVELMNGTFAEVAEVLEDGGLVLEHEDTYIREVLAPGTWDLVILHVVGRQP